MRAKRIFVAGCIMGISIMCLIAAEGYLYDVPIFTVRGKLTTGSVVNSGTTTQAGTLTMADDIALIFGSDSDIQAAYDETTDNRFEITDGTNNLMHLTDAGTTGNLVVTGTTTSTGTLAATAAATVGTTLGVTGATTLTGALTSNGNATLGNATSDTLTMTGVQSSLRWAQYAEAGAHTSVVTDDVIILDTSAGGRTLTLGAVATIAPGKIYTVINQGGSGGVNTLTIATNGSELLDGLTADYTALDASSDSLMLYTNGVEWFIIGEHLN